MRGVIDVAVISIAFALGWVAATLKVAEHCEMVGGFYVFSTVYECKVKEEAK
jgi:hypothetical protein